MKSVDIRQAFLDFFESKKHTIVPSAPMVVKNDPTLMFTNAGMNQFKDIFLGNEPSQSVRMADTQKCLRVSGKHNDLEEVGHDTYHHTMFEMLGNWSFGDYFKNEAIDWAWELLVDVFKLPEERIYATVFEGYDEDNLSFDQDAYDCWRKHLPESHILRGNKRDNFWEMGESGPCGPCSEVHFDLRSDNDRALIDGATLVNESHPLVIEIWNLVFMQFNRKASGKLLPLPLCHVDTGMGFERLCMIMQGVQSSYDTDVFTPIISKIEALSGLEYGKDKSIDIAMRVISDHLRAICFSIAEGQMPSNVKAGYVIRRILRRAVRYAYTYLNIRTPMISKLVPTLVSQMGGAFVELKSNSALIERVIQEEENSFLRTLATGINLLEDIISKLNGDTISGKDAFTLYDTYGFPIDLTQLIAQEKGVSVDISSFDKELMIQKERSRGAAAIQTDDWVVLHPIERSEFIGYDNDSYTIKIARYRKQTSKNNSTYQLVFDKTPFYGNSGGQVGERGFISNINERVAIINTLKDNNLTIHIVEHLPVNLTGNFTASVNQTERLCSVANHTATHLLHKSLKQVLGSHVEQKGSLVTPDYLRFDFSHFKKVSTEELREVSRIVNSEIRANHLIEENRDCPIDEARGQGAEMLFGEKYGTVVRTIKFGDSFELCGGLHADATGDLGLFTITSEGSSSAGVRRIEAITASMAEENTYKQNDLLHEIAGKLNSSIIIDALTKLSSDSSLAKQKMEELRILRDNYLVKELINDAAIKCPLNSEDLSTTNNKNSTLTIISSKLDVSAESLKHCSFEIKNRIDNVAVVLGSTYEDKPTLSVLLSDSLVSRGFSASVIVREASKFIEGGGGGQSTYATAGGKNINGLDKAISTAIDIIKSSV